MVQVRKGRRERQNKPIVFTEAIRILRHKWGFKVKDRITQGTRGMAMVHWEAETRMKTDKLSLSREQEIIWVAAQLRAISNQEEHRRTWEQWANHQVKEGLRAEEQHKSQQETGKSWQVFTRKKAVEILLSCFTVSPSIHPNQRKSYQLEVIIFDCPLTSTTLLVLSRQDFNRYFLLRNTWCLGTIFEQNWNCIHQGTSTQST